MAQYKDIARFVDALQLFDGEAEVEVGGFTRRAAIQQGGEGILHFGVTPHGQEREIALHLPAVSRFRKLAVGSACF